jgi:hypothetical protein
VFRRPPAMPLIVRSIARTRSSEARSRRSRRSSSAWTNESGSTYGLRSSQRPEDDDRAVIAGRPDQRQRSGLDLDQTSLGADAVAPVRRPPLAQGRGKRQPVGRERIAALVERAEFRVPLLSRQAARLLEASSDHLPGRVVVEHDVPLDVHEKRRQRDGRDQVARQDQLQRLLLALA